MNYLKHQVCLLGLFIFSAAFADPTPLEKLSDKTSRRQDSVFEFPFLMAQTAVLVDKSAEEVTKQVKTFLEKRKLPIAGHYAKEKKGNAQLELPAEVRTGNQLEAISECTVEKCQVKLNTEREKKQMEAASEKLPAYQKIVSQRIDDYLTRQELLGYENRESNKGYLKQMMELFPVWKKSYPALAAFFSDGFWKGAAAPKSLGQTFLREELVIIAPERLQPIWRIGEVFEFDESQAKVFWEIHVYSNHYMDSSMRIVEIIPRGKKTALAISDIMEIDELTKSGLIRMLYKGKMGEAVMEAQNQDLKKILSP